MSEKLSRFSPREAVIDAMHQATAIQFLNYFQDQLPPSVQQQQDPLFLSEQDRLISTITDSFCFQACADTLIFCHERYPHLFDYFLGVSASDISDFQSHAVFLVHAKRGEWYLGSPANIPKDDTYQTPLHQEKLSLLIGQLKQKRPGNWPPLSAIEEMTTFDPGGMVPEYVPGKKLYTIPWVDRSGNKVKTAHYLHYINTPLFNKPIKGFESNS